MYMKPISTAAFKDKAEIWPTGNEFHCWQNVEVISWNIYLGPRVVFTVGPL